MGLSPSRSTGTTLRVSLLVSLLATLSAHALPAPEVVNLPGAPFQLRAVAEPIGAPAGLVDVAFELRNTGKVTLNKIGVQAVVFTASGDPRGFFVFETPVHVRPGAVSYTRAGTSQFTALPGDRAILLPYSAEGRVFRWQSSEEQNRRIRRALVNTRGDASQVDARDPAHPASSIGEPAVTPQNPTPPPDDPYGGTCTACQNAPTTCKDFCSPCFPGSYSCTCQPISITCSCGRCPG